MTIPARTVAANVILVPNKKASSSRQGGSLGPLIRMHYIGMRESELFVDNVQQRFVI